jgi:hypothetical protein
MTQAQVEAILRAMLAIMMKKHLITPQDFKELEPEIMHAAMQIAGNGDD